MSNKPVTKKQYSDFFNECVGVILPEECGEPLNPDQWELQGFFDGYNVYKRID